MSHIQTFENPSPFKECDVLVCGGGPSGFAAAVAAARAGAKTILVERNDYPGGMMTAGMVNPIYGFFSRHIQVANGISQELVENLGRIPGGTPGHTYRDDCVAFRRKHGECVTGEVEMRCPVATVSKVCPVNSELARVVMLQMLAAAGVEDLYSVTVTGTRVADGVINGVVIHGKSGFRWISPKVVIDATGDADVSFLSGVAFQSGFLQSQISKPPTLMFKITGADFTKDRIRIDLPIEPGIHQTYAWLMALPEKGSYTVNAPSEISDFNSTDMQSLSNSQKNTTLKMFALFTWLKENISECKNIRLHSMAASLGIRDSRRIHGKYELTEDDVVTARKFPLSGIANGVHPIDLHVNVKELGNRNLIFLPCGDYYQIPYECLLPVGIHNLLVAGRSISSSFVAQASIRVMATCMSIGQAAGTAAALSVKDDRPVDEIDPIQLRNQLISDGVYLGKENDTPSWNRGEAPLPAGMGY